MCGINGFNWKDEKLASVMNDSIRHRGPDGEGTYSCNDVTFGHLRLSIIDLSEKGHQPMGLDKNGIQIYQDDKLPNSELTIVFNGEIYNFQEIRKELGIKFNSDSDTEVILRAYKKWGPNCVKKFNGMWAFCIYDKKQNLLFLSRDRLGVKPLHYYFEKDEFIFSSEIKGILSAKKINKKENINKSAVELYFSLGYIPAPHTIFKNIFKLEAGHNLLFNLKSKKLEIKKYYNLPKYAPIWNKKELVKEGRSILLDATRLRMISDVPVGAFLSGGLDSSSVVGAMSKNTNLNNLHTFSIGFEQKYDNGRYDETKYVNIVQKYYGTKHHHYYYTKKDFEKDLDKYSLIYDEPFGDYSGFPTYKISNLARKNVTVVLSGDGGDEIFGGYTLHQMGARMELLRKSPKILRILVSKIPVKKNLDNTASFYLLREAMTLSLKNKEQMLSESITAESYKPQIYKKWTEKYLKYSLVKGRNKLSEGLRIYDLLFNTLQSNFLVKVDRASMRAPIEVRSPFLDYRFVEFAQKIPSEWKVNATKTKIIMRDIIKDIVPSEIIDRNKQGFEPPLDKWIDDKIHSEYIENNIEIIKKIDTNLYTFFVDKALNGKGRFYKIYKIRLLLFLKWWNTWMT
jgi:asparagine synthase (glutamine-hydrolysing)